MAKTLVSDVIIPTEFEKYAIERTAELSRFGDSGIVEVAPEFDSLAQETREICRMIAGLIHYLQTLDQKQKRIFPELSQPPMKPEMSWKAACASVGRFSGLRENLWE